jgi:hypothetical protein
MAIGRWTCIAVMAGVAVVLTLAILSKWLWFVVALRSGCRSAVWKEYPSPGEELKVVVWSEDCGATVSTDERVSVGAAARNLKRAVKCFDGIQDQFVTTACSVNTWLRSTCAGTDWIQWPSDILAARR